MNRILITLSIMLLSFAWQYADAQSTATDSQTYQLVLSKLKKPLPPVEGEPDPDPDPVGSRIPQRRLMGEISPMGVNIQGVDKSEIISFELYAEDEMCVGIFLQEQEFLTFLYSLSGTFELRFITDGYVYIGLIDL